MLLLLTGLFYVYGLACANAIINYKRRKTMSKKELNNTGAKPDKKLRTKELIYAGAFGALYIVLMLVIVLGTSMIPILYILAPITVGLVCGTVYMLICCYVTRLMCNSI